METKERKGSTIGRMGQSERDDPILGSGRWSVGGTKGGLQENGLILGGKEGAHKGKQETQWARVT